LLHHIDEEYTEEFNNCNVCGEELEGAKKKKW
jgi:hypothetical protein